MTDKQIAEAKSKLPQWENGNPPVLNQEQEQLEKELRCRDMINSILCYHGCDNVMQNRYLQDYIEELGMKLVQKLVDEQIEDFKKAIVKQNVYTDCEGLSYNSIIWADEQ